MDRRNARKVPLSINIRPMERFDLERVGDIEADSAITPATTDEINEFRLSRDVSAMVAEYNNEVVGFFVCQEDRNAVQILELAVSPIHRNQGLGGELLEYIKKRCQEQGGYLIVAKLLETDQEAQQFLLHHGFEANDRLQEKYWTEDEADMITLCFSGNCHTHHPIPQTDERELFEPDGLE